jgi:hypothetical protein
VGGFERYIQSGPSFWIDLWEIINTERNPILQWSIQEVSPEEEPKKEKPQMSKEGPVAIPATEKGTINTSPIQVPTTKIHTGINKPTPATGNRRRRCQ